MRARWFLSLLTLPLLLACGTAEDLSAPAATRDEATLRDTPSGRVIGGVGTNGSHVWRGIPFAEPPVGDLRWRAPRAAVARSRARRGIPTPS